MFMSALFSVITFLLFIVFVVAGVAFHALLELSISALVKYGLRKLSHLSCIAVQALYSKAIILI
jgi:hypothetical protein